MVEQRGDSLNSPRTRLSRRSILKGATVGAAGLALVSGAGCAVRGGSSKPSGSQTDRPQRGGTIRRRTVTTAFSGGFDPHIQQGSQTGEMGFFYQGLVRLNPKTIAVEPEIAQKWEQPSQTEYVFHLQPG